MQKNKQKNKPSLHRPTSTKSLKIGDLLMYVGDWNGVSGLDKGELVEYLGRELSFVRDQNGDPEKVRDRWREKIHNPKKYFVVWVNVRSLFKDKEGRRIEQKVQLSHLAYPPHLIPKSKT